jgi:anti-sigma-K factor RskA
MLAQDHVTDSLPAFVLGALDEEERRQVSIHLEHCHLCQAELASLQQVADELPLAISPADPSPELKVRLMQSILQRTGERQPEPFPADQSTFLQRGFALFRHPLPALGVALIILLVVGNLLLWRQLNLATQRAFTPMRVVALANTQNLSQATGTLIMDPAGKYGTLVMDNLATLDPASQYQVWLLKAGVRSSAGVFSVNQDGYASLELLAPIPLIQYDAIGISIEPAGGSQMPTGASVFHADLIR